MPHPTGAVVFDMDGVLVDVEPMHFRILQEILALEGHHISERDFVAVIGGSVRDTVDHFVKRFGMAGPVERCVRRYETLVAEALDNVRPTDGAVDLLEEIQESGTPMGLASSAQKKWIVKTLEKLDLERYFPVVVSGEEIDHGKPEPDIYLAAAARLGVSPSECAAVEDAPKGIQSAKTAGMRVIAVRASFVDPGSQAAADVCVGTINQITLGMLGIDLANGRRSAASA